ncbi:hypothetical protein BT69DRAFT_1260270 [Atractiella rhizophila]|nr:hypothetical protein BT69DRAFT_1260270 [Atractiella rhizophila]
MSSNPNWHIDRVLDRPGPFTDEAFVGGQTARDFLQNECKILVIGAGGLGCEILANLSKMGFRDIHVIDMDTIDISNLNRQFLFRDADVGKPKATVAAEFIMRRCPEVKVTPYYGKIQDKDEAYYKQFNIIICGLDSIPARRWINATLVQMVDEDDPESLKPMIDGGTEGFRGQARVILPTINACYECSLDMHTPPTAFPICTIASTPRLPEHCIEWASVIEWPRVFGDKKLDNDDPDHIQWLYEQASERANKYKIEGVTWQSTQGVVKRIIPAIASTNAIIAAACCNEAFKLATTSAPSLDNYMMFTGNVGIYTHTFSLDRKPDCPVCGSETLESDVNGDWTLQEFIDSLIERPDTQVKKPSLLIGTRKLYFQAPPQFEKQTRPNLSKKISELCQAGDTITIQDSAYPFAIYVKVNFS